MCIGISFVKKPARLLSPWDSLDKSTGKDCHFLLQGIFLTQGLNPPLLRLLHCWQILYHCPTWVQALLLYVSQSPSGLAYYPWFQVFLSLVLEQITHALALLSNSPSGPRLQLLSVVAVVVVHIPVYYRIRCLYGRLFSSLFT